MRYTGHTDIIEGNPVEAVLIELENEVIKSRIRNDIETIPSWSALKIEIARYTIFLHADSKFAEKTLARLGPDILAVKKHFKNSHEVIDQVERLEKTVAHALH
jgi:hypothetical protein